MIESQAIGQEQLAQVDLSSGECVFVQPLPVYVTAAFQQQADELFPAPDPAPYQRQIPEAFEGVLTPPEESPTYVRLKAEAQDKRNRWWWQRILLSGVVVDCVGGREAAIARHAERLAQITRLIPPPSEDVWLATVMLCMARTGQDVARITQAAMKTLSETEVLDGVRLFFRPLQRL